MERVGLYLNVWVECNRPMSGCQLVSCVKRIVMVVLEWAATNFYGFPALVMWEKCQVNVIPMM